MTVWLVCNLVKELYTLVDEDRNSPVCWVTKLMELASVFSLYVTTMFTQLEMVIKVSPEPQELIEPIINCSCGAGALLPAPHPRHADPDSRPHHPGLLSGRLRGHHHRPRHCGHGPGSAV